MSILSAGNTALAKEAFAQTWDLLKTRRAILIPFYRNYALLFGIAIFAFVLFTLFVGSVGPIVAVTAYVLSVSICTWYLSAMAIGTIVTVGAEYWHGVRVTTADAGKTIIPRMHAAMFADMPGMLQVGIIIVLSVGISTAPNTLARFTATHQAAQIGLGVWLILTALGACLVPILSAYTALSIRAITRSESSAGVAIRQAHTEIFEHRSEYFALMLYIGILSFGVSAICQTLNVVANAHGGVFIVSSVITTALQIFQLMPFVWLAQHFEPQALVVADEATIAGFDFVIPSIHTRKPPSIIMIVASICAGVGLFIGVAFTVLLGTLAHKANLTLDPAKIQAIQADIGLTQPPKWFKAEMASSARPLGNGLSVASIIFVPSEGPQTVKLSVSEEISEPPSTLQAVPASKHSDKSCGNAAKVAVAGSKPAITIYQTGCSKDRDITVTGADADFRIGNRAYTIVADGDVGPDTINAIKSIALTLQSRKIASADVQKVVAVPVQVHVRQQPTPPIRQAVTAKPLLKAPVEAAVVAKPVIARVVAVPLTAPLAPVAKSKFDITAKGMTAIACSTPKLMPVDENTTTSLTVTNRSATALAVEWIDYMSTRERITTVYPGSTWSTSTYATSPWAITSKGHCEAVFIASADPGIILIK